MKALKSLFARPFGNLKTLMPELKKLRSSLENLSTAEPIENLVELFNIISPWHDRGLNDLKEKFALKSSKECKEALAVLNELQLHFKNAGRCEFGFNRTKPGQAVTTDDVFLGDVYGLWTKKASYWLSAKNTSQKRNWGYPGMENMSPYDVISREALGFINSHKGRMIELINELERTMQ